MHKKNGWLAFIIPIFLASGESYLTHAHPDDFSSNHHLCKNRDGRQVNTSRMLEMNHGTETSKKEMNDTEKEGFVGGGLNP